MGDFFRRFTPFERVLLLAAVVAALAAIGDLGRGEGPLALLLALVVTGACVAAAGGSRKRRLLGEHRRLGPIEQLENDQPLVFVAVTGVILGGLFAATTGVIVGFLFAAAWIGSQLATTR